MGKRLCGRLDGFIGKDGFGDKEGIFVVASASGRKDILNPVCALCSRSSRSSPESQGREEWVRRKRITLYKQKTLVGVASNFLHVDVGGHWVVADQIFFFFCQDEMIMSSKMSDNIDRALYPSERFCLLICDAVDSLMLSPFQLFSCTITHLEHVVMLGPVGR